MPVEASEGHGSILFPHDWMCHIWEYQTYLDALPCKCKYIYVKAVLVFSLFVWLMLKR